MGKIYTFFIKTFLCCILFLIVAILCKSNLEWKNFVQNKVYGQSISFANLKKIYKHYLGGIFPLEIVDKSEKVASVFNDEFTYTNLVTYENGVALSVNKQYLVPALEDGIVVYVGEKEKYKNVVIVENLDGINFWYGNLCNIGVKLYDNIKSGTYLGEVCDETLYMIFSKGNKYLDYKDYID